MLSDDGKTFIYILFTCNSQQEPESLKLVCATTDRQALLYAIAGAIETEFMTYNNRAGKGGLYHFRKDCKRGELDFNRLGCGAVRILRDGAVYLTDTERRINPNDHFKQQVFEVR